jgi:hypothetical protein
MTPEKPDSLWFFRGMPSLEGGSSLGSRGALLGRAGEEGRHQDKHGPGDKTELKIIDCISAAVLYICKFKGQNNSFQYET